MVKVCRRFTLKAIHTRHHSPAAAYKPRSEHWRKPKEVFDHAQHRFDCPFAQAVDGAANVSLEFVSHVDLRTGIRWW